MDLILTLEPSASILKTVQIKSVGIKSDQTLRVVRSWSPRRSILEHGLCVHCPTHSMISGSAIIDALIMDFWINENPFTDEDLYL